MTLLSDSGDHRQEFIQHLEGVGKRVDQILDHTLKNTSRHPRVVYKAMRYTALSGGKRLRPALVILSYQACAAPDQAEHGLARLPRPNGPSRRTAGLQDGGCRQGHG